MTMKICYAPIVDGRMEMPTEILEVLPQGIPLYMRTDPERGTVIILAKEPASSTLNQWYFDVKTEQGKDPDWWENQEDGPIPPELLSKKKIDNEDE